MSPRLVLLLPLALSALAGMGCGGENIPNTDVPDTSENREVVQFVERYRLAVEERNVGAILALCSNEYFDDNGTPNGVDDLDIELLRERLARWEQLLDVRYDIRYRRVTFRDDLHVLVDFTFAGRFRVQTPEGERWARRLGDNRIVLARENGEYRILSGL
jgi:hypothetical protein